MINIIKRSLVVVGVLVVLMVGNVVLVVDVFVGVILVEK